MAAHGSPSFAGPTLSRETRACWDKRVYSGPSWVEAGFGSDSPVEKTVVSCEPGPLGRNRRDVSQGSNRWGLDNGRQVVLLAAGGRRVKNLGGARRYGLLPPTGHGNHLGKMISACISG